MLRGFYPSSQSFGNAGKCTECFIFLVLQRMEDLLPQSRNRHVAPAAPAAPWEYQRPIAPGAAHSENTQMRCKSTHAPAAVFPADGRELRLRLSLFSPTLVVHLQTGHVVHSASADLDEHDCFVETARPFPAGSRVNLQIARETELFSAFGRVVFVSRAGMRIVYSVLNAESRDLLKKWLNVLQVGEGRSL
jgi:hypothetical protein